MRRREEACLVAASRGGDGEDGGSPPERGVHVGIQKAIQVVRLGRCYDAGHKALLLFCARPICPWLRRFLANHLYAGSQVLSLRFRFILRGLEPNFTASYTSHTSRGSGASSRTICIAGSHGRPEPKNKYVLRVRRRLPCLFMVQL